MARAAGNEAGLRLRRPLNKAVFPHRTIRERNESLVIYLSVADLLRGDYKQSEYGRVILPFTVLRRLDCVLQDTKEAVLAEFAKRQQAGLNPEPLLLRKSGQLFYNTGISTYIWIVSNRKPERRKGKVQLIDASGYWQKRRQRLLAKKAKEPRQQAEGTEQRADHAVVWQLPQGHQSRGADQPDF